MQHRNITTTHWSTMAIDSLFTRGQLSDWREFVKALRQDPTFCERALRVAQNHEDRGAAALLQLLLDKQHPR